MSENRKHIVHKFRNTAEFITDAELAVLRDFYKKLDVMLADMGAEFALALNEVRADRRRLDDWHSRRAA